MIVKMISWFASVGLIWLLAGCEEQPEPIKPLGKAPSTHELGQFVAEMKDQLVFVEGGEFVMGNYGASDGYDSEYLQSSTPNNPAHRVELSSYSIAKFKTTNMAYQLYLRSKGLPLRIPASSYTKDWASISTTQNIPANVDWYEANGYCKWLAEISGLPFALPTEAQWEYAARSRGQFLAVATDDGTYKITDDPYNEDGRYGPKGINTSTTRDRKAFAAEKGWRLGIEAPLPVDRYPPNPLGLYSMSDNGLEWVQDWYDPDYYRYSPFKDPQGPDGPVFKDGASDNKFAKVLRGAARADPKWPEAMNLVRGFRSPDGYIYVDVLDDPHRLFISDKTVRCVVNSPRPIKE